MSLLNCGFRNLIQQEKYMKGIYSTIFVSKNRVYISDSLTKSILVKLFHSRQTLSLDSTNNLFLIICFVLVLHQFTVSTYYHIHVHNFWGLDGFLIVPSWWVGFMGVKLQIV